MSAITLEVPRKNVEKLFHALRVVWDSEVEGRETEGEEINKLLSLLPSVKSMQLNR